MFHRVSIALFLWQTIYPCTSQENTICCYICTFSARPVSFGTLIVNLNASHVLFPRNINVHNHEKWFSSFKCSDCYQIFKIVFFVNCLRISSNHSSSKIYNKLATNDTDFVLNPLSHAAYQCNRMSCSSFNAGLQFSMRKTILCTIFKILIRWYFFIYVFKDYGKWFITQAYVYVWHKMY